MEKHVKIILNPSTKNCFAQIVRIVNRRKTASDTSSNHCPWGVLNNNTEKGKKTLFYCAKDLPSGGFDKTTKLTRRAQSYLFYDNLLSSSSSSENSRDVFHHFDRQPKSAKMSFHNLFRNCPSSGLVIFVVMSMWTPVSYCGFEKLLSSKFFKTFFPKKLCFKSIQG